MTHKTTIITKETAVHTYYYDKCGEAIGASRKTCKIYKCDICSNCGEVLLSNKNYLESIFVCKECIKHYNLNEDLDIYKRYHKKINDLKSEINSLEYDIQGIEFNINQTETELRNKIKELGKRGD